MGIPLLLIVLVITIYVCNRTIQKNSETYIYSTVSDIPYNKVGLLLGTSPKLKSGKANLYFDYRIKAAVGAQFNATDHVGLYVEPGVSYFFDDGSKVQTIRKERPCNFNLQAGLRFTY